MWKFLEYQKGIHINIKFKISVYNDKTSWQKDNVFSKIKSGTIICIHLKKKVCSCGF